MAKTANQVIAAAQKILLDDTGVRWPATELLSYLNDGQREIVTLKPEANTVATPLQLAAGTRQSLPAGGVMLFAVTRNLGTDGQTPGPVVAEIPQQTLDAVLPGWHMAAPSATVLHFCFEERDPKRFLVYPPQPSANRGYVEVLHSALPAECTLEGALSLADEYANLLGDYVLSRAYAKDTEAGSDAKAAGYRQSFLQGLGVKEVAEAKNEPAKSRRPGPAQP
jgi:hypothetical protein